MFKSRKILLPARRRSVFLYNVSREKISAIIYLITACNWFRPRGVIIIIVIPNYNNYVHCIRFQFCYVWKYDNATWEIRRVFSAIYALCTDIFQRILLKKKRKNALKTVLIISSRFRKRSESCTESLRSFRISETIIVIIIIVGILYNRDTHITPNDAVFCEIFFIVSFRFTQCICQWPAK